ncbi:MAG: diguanylate cyclase [Solirubrobacteraceae bacterium]|nr:diguanylate cyclase [Solirubrobacteraceae bacterium]
MASTAFEAGPLSVSVREERDLRISTAAAMWGGGGVMVVLSLLVGAGGDGGTPVLVAIIGLAALCVAVALVLGPRLSTPWLYRLTMLLCGMGAPTIIVAASVSGDATSCYWEIFFLPAMYSAYFARPRDVAWQLALCIAGVLSTFVWAADPTADAYPARAAVIILGCCAIALVITRQKRNLLLAEAAARGQAMSDPLTGAHNLRSLRERAQREPFATGDGLLLIDIDDFKAVNSHFGHTGADRLLTEIVTELESVVRPGDLVARVGGDEFAVLARGRTDGELRHLVVACEAAVGRARSGTGMPGFDLSASVGAAAWPDDGEDLLTLLDAADREMYVRKATHRRAAPIAVVAEPDPVVAGPGPRLVVEPPAACTSRGFGRRISAWLAARPERATAGAAAWLGAAVATCLVLVLPASDIGRPELVAAICAAGLGVAGLLLVLSTRLGPWIYTVSDVIAGTGIVTVVALTGGTTSPVLPFVFLLLSLSAWFSPRRDVLVQLGAAIAICATPFLYASPDERVDYLVRFVVLVSTAAVLAVVISHNRRQLTEAERVAREQARQDPLTQLPNRRAFHDRLTEALAPSGSRPDPLVCAAIVDLDNFKRVNDLHGHAAGDLVLRAVAEALAEVVRRGDMVARIGGDEFAIVAPDADLATGRALCERCVEAVEEAVERTGHGDCGVSASVGFALFRRHAAGADELLEAADAALLRAKSEGKRRVASAERAAVV